MKKFYIWPLIAALAFFVSCQKQQTAEEKKAEPQTAEEKQRLELRDKKELAEKIAANVPAEKSVTPAASPAH